MPRQTGDSKSRKLQVQEELQTRKFQPRKLRIQQLSSQKFEKQAKIAKLEQPKGDPRFRVIDMAMKRSGYSQEALIEVLHKIQETFGYLDDEVLSYVTRELKLPLSFVYGVATFYHLFALKPKGDHNCVVCLGTACYVKGSQKILAALEKYLDIKAGETTPDEKISLLTARCMGACGIAPAATLDGKVSGKQTPVSLLAAVKELIASGKAQEIKEKVELLTKNEQPKEIHNGSVIP